MRLSEAIRLGAMLSPQTRGAFFKRRGQEVATCALGAAVEATGMEASGGVWQWPVLNTVVPPAELPDRLRGGSHPLRVFEVIIALNDRCGWTRTAIADWIEEFESRHPERPRERTSFPQFGPAEAFYDDSEDDLAVLCVR
jgi:hypothetical protein